MREYLRWIPAADSYRWITMLGKPDRDVSDGLSEVAILQHCQTKFSRLSKI